MREKFLLAARFPPMSVAELKSALDNLTEDERLELAEHLRWRARKDDPEWQAELAHRVDRCVAGRGHSAEELDALHDRLSREGK